MSQFSIFEVSASALSAQSKRMNVSASNLANADSVTGPNGEPYRAKQIIFQTREATDGISGVDAVGLVESDLPFREEYDPGNPFADESGYVRKSNVEPLNEMIDMMAASKSYQASIEVMNTNKQLMLKTLTLGEG